MSEPFNQESEAPYLVFEPQGRSAAKIRAMLDEAK